MRAVGHRVTLCLVLVACLLIVTTGCGAGATPTTVPPTTKATTGPTAVPATAAPKATATAVPPTAPAGPTTGGTLVSAMAAEPDTLDVQKSLMTSTESVMSLVGAALVSQDPTTGKFVPYLADSWTFSADGLTWTFKLHPGVKFHDGTPLTAQDYAWTFNRALDPATKSVSTGAMLSSLKSAEATDAQTLVLHLKSAFYYLLQTLSQSSFTSPLPQAAVTKAGDAWGRAPVGCGPFKFGSWQTGTKIVIQRNPDYNWRPAWNTGKGPYLDAIEYRIIPDSTTIQAGLEAGEIDLASVPTKDLARTKATGKINVLNTYLQGCSLLVMLNHNVPALADPAVRQAMSYAVDRRPFIEAIWSGDAVPQLGPLSQSQAGFDKVQETYALPLDVAKAKSTLASAGYVAGSDGIMAKGDVKLKFAITTLSGNDSFVNVAQIVQQQWKAIGIQADIQQVDGATLAGSAGTGKYEACVLGYSYANADVMVLLFGSNAIGGANYLQINDPAFDTLLLATRSTLDAAKQQAAVNAVVKYLADGNHLVTFGTPKISLGLSNRVKGFTLSPVTGAANFLDAYIPK